MGLYPIYRSVYKSSIRAKWQGARALCVSTQRSSCVISMNGASHIFKMGCLFHHQQSKAWVVQIRVLKMHCHLATAAADPTVCILLC